MHMQAIPARAEQLPLVHPESRSRISRSGLLSRPMDETRHVRAFRGRHVRWPEKQLAWAHADVRDEKGKPEPFGDGVLVVTTRRLAFYRKGVVWDRLEWVDLWDVSSIARSSRWGTEVFTFAGPGFKLVVGCQDDVGFEDCIELVEAAREPGADVDSLIEMASKFRYTEPEGPSGMVRVLRVGVPFIVLSFIAGRVLEWSTPQGPSAGDPASRKGGVVARDDASVGDVRRRFELSLSGLESPLIERVSVDRRGGVWSATITVSNLWHVRAYQVRFQDAQTLWNMWARTAPTKDADSARISIVDQNGNEVGGSRVWAGSLIWVQEK